MIDSSKELLSYKGYTGYYEAQSDGTFIGNIDYIKAIVMFESNTLQDLKVEFELAVDDYLETCIELGYKPESGGRISHWYDEIDTTPTSNEHDADKLSNILDYIESSNLSVELFGAFIKEYAESKDIDQAWSWALDDWDCDGGELWNFITRVSG